MRIKKHLESLANGLGGQSVYLFWMACRGMIPATVSITGDTGSEQDRVWNTGERTTAKEYYEQVLVPIGNKHGIEMRFVRAVTKDGKDQLSVSEAAAVVHAGGKRRISIPAFGSRGGRAIQSCTDKWKIKAIKQEARRMGATTMRSAQGIHVGEASRRVKGKFLGMLDGFETYQTSWKNRKTGQEHVIKWLTHYYPLVELKMNRLQVQNELQKLGIPYLISSECDMCPHQDLARWLRHTPESLARSAELEASFGGEYFLTPKRIPLLDAIEAMKKESPEQPTELDFGCENNHCGI